MTDSKKHDSDSADSASAPTDRRGFLKAAGLAGAGALAGAEHGKLSLSPISTAQAATPPKLSEGGAKWWPSKWVADDQAGASNHIPPEKVLDAAKWIKDGKIYRIGHNYDSTMPLFGKRAFTLRIPGSPTGGPFGANGLLYPHEVR